MPNTACDAGNTKLFGLITEHFKVAGKFYSMF